MRLKFHFVPQALKNLKIILTLIHKLIQTQSPVPKVYIVYFIRLRSIRILVDSSRSPVVISMSHQMLTSQNLCVLKQDKDIISFTFDNSLRFFQSLIQIIEKQDLNGIIFDLRRQKGQNDDKRFLKITFKNNDGFYVKLPIDPPRYDQHPIKYHLWISGCIQAKKIVQFLMSTEQLITMLRFLTKMKQYAASKLILTFNFEQKIYECRSSDTDCLQNTRGQFKYSANPAGVQEIAYQIASSNLKLVQEMIKKFKQLKIIIDINYSFILVYMKEDLFVTHMKMAEWIKPISTRITGDPITKIQHRQQDQWA